MKMKRQVSLQSLWGRMKKSNLDHPECSKFDNNNDIDYDRAGCADTTNKREDTCNTHERLPMTTLYEKELSTSKRTAVTTPGYHQDDKKQDDDTPYQPSEYELLRLKNIARNEARLRELGLLSTNKSNSYSLSTPKIKKRKPLQDKSNKVILDIPPRRSARLSNNIGQQSIPSSSLVIKDDNLPIITPNNKEDDAQYVPLLQCKAGKQNETSIASLSTNCTDGIGPMMWLTEEKVPSIQSIQSKLVPPSGLTAIYSLQFSPSCYHHTSTTSKDDVTPSSFLVGAGKSGIIALWDLQKSNRHPPLCQNKNNNNFDDNTGYYEAAAAIDPVLSWKAHSGRWISSAFFIAPNTYSSTSSTSINSGTILPSPQQLMTAGNDGHVCVWDISTVHCSTGVPRLNYQSGNDLHTSGIFSMDVLMLNQSSSSQPIITGVCTGSKDKTVALSEFTPTEALRTTWRSNYHTSKVGAVRIQPGRERVTLIASASDDGNVAIHDIRTSTIAASIPNAHNKPHSVEWSPSESSSNHQFITAGLDDTIHLFDLRNLSKPIRYFRGHVSSSLQKVKSIHRPVLSRCTSSSGNNNRYLITGGEGTRSLFIYSCEFSAEAPVEIEEQTQHLLRQGLLPQGCGDAGSIAIQDNQVCVSTASGDILLLAPIPLQQ